MMHTSRMGVRAKKPYTTKVHIKTIRAIFPDSAHQLILYKPIQISLTKTMYSNTKVGRKSIRATLPGNAY